MSNVEKYLLGLAILVLTIFGLVVSVLGVAIAVTIIQRILL